MNSKPNKGTHFESLYFFFVTFKTKGELYETKCIKVM